MRGGAVGFERPRSRETATWSRPRAVGGASSPHTSATSRSAATGAPCAASSTERTPRSRRRVRGWRTPSTVTAIAPKAAYVTRTPEW